MKFPFQVIKISKYLISIFDKISEICVHQMLVNTFFNVMGNNNFHQYLLLLTLNQTNALFWERQLFHLLSKRAKIILFVDLFFRKPYYDIILGKCLNCLKIFVSVARDLGVIRISNNNT